MRWIRAALSLIIVFAMALNNMAPARAAAPLVIPAGAYAASYAFAAGAVAVGAIGTAVGYEYGDEIRQVGIDVWHKTSDTAKQAWQSAIDAAVAANTMIVSIAQDVGNSISSAIQRLYNTAYPQQSVGDLTISSNWPSPYNSDSTSINYSNKDYRISIKGHLCIAASFINGIGVAEPYVLYQYCNTGSNIQIPAPGSHNQAGLNAIKGWLVAQGATIVYVPQDYNNNVNYQSVKTNVITANNTVTIPPITTIQPKVKTTGEQLYYDYVTGTTTYVSTGEPFTGSIDDDVIWDIPQIKSQVVDGQRQVGFALPQLGQDFINLKNDTITYKPYSIPGMLEDFALANPPADDLINLDLTDNKTYPLDFVFTPDTASIADLDIVITPTGIAEVDQITGLITSVGAGSATLTIKAKDAAITKEITLTINVTDAISGDQTGVLDRIGDAVDTIADSISNPVGDVNDIQWDKLKTTASIFTTKFPFSLPWDVYNAFVAVFGDVADADPPEWVWEYWGNTMVISIPQVLVDMSQYFRAAILILFDIGMIYAVRKLLGGAS